MCSRRIRCDKDRQAEADGGDELMLHLEIIGITPIGISPPDAA
jgi:hypothetical protein